jgi:hypothetical protein
MEIMSSMFHHRSRTIYTVNGILPISIHPSDMLMLNLSSMMIVRHMVSLIIIKSNRYVKIDDIRMLTMLDRVYITIECDSFRNVIQQFEFNSKFHHHRPSIIHSKNISMKIFRILFPYIQYQLTQLFKP